MVSFSGEKNITVKMNEEFIARLDKIAQLAKRSRHQMIKNMVEIGIEELERLKFVGVFQLGLLARDLHEAVVNICNIKRVDPVAGDKSIPVKLDDEYLERLDSLALKGGLTRNQLVKNLVRIGVEEAESLAKLGVLQFVVLIRDLPESIRKICTKGEAALKAYENEFTP